MTRAVLCALLILNTAVLQGGAAPQQPGPLRVIVSPRTAWSPARIRIEAIIQPAAEDRSLVVVIESDAYYRSSTIALSGLAGPRVHTREFANVPAGAHRVRVTIVDGRERARAQVEDFVQVG